MILAPRSQVTARIMRRSPVVVAALSAVHVVTVVTGGVRPGELRSAATAAAALATPTGFLSAWVHMLAFDLLVGRAIWERGLASGRGTRLVLLITWATGPTGWLVWTAKRALPPA
jgi:hypothetical protein